MRDVAGVGSFTVLGFVLIAVVLYLALSSKGRTALFVGFSVVGGTILSTGLKMLFDRPRPDGEASTRVFAASFSTLGLLLAEAIPGGHLKTCFIGLGIFMTLAVGLSGVYLGVHYPTDVLAGWSLGTAWALACWSGYALLFGRKDEKSAE